MYHTLFFDLDNTLYPADSGIWETIGARINEFVLEITDMGEDEVTEFRDHCRETYGTTLKGLKKKYNVEDQQYLEYVHDIDLSKYLVNDGRLRKMIDALPQRKIIFTNSDEKHARRVLRFMDIEEYFELIIDVVKLEPYVKPQKESFQLALELADLSTTEGCVFIDDMHSNVASASEMGFFSILVSRQRDTDYPHQIGDIYELPNLLNGYKNE
jgi:pyrimidine 5'-nucleotidase